MNLDFSFIVEYMPYYFEGIKYTLLISFVAVLFGAVFGSLLFYMKSSNFHIWKIKPLKIIAVAYIEIIRGTPMILQIFIVYAGAEPFFGMDLSALQAAFVAIALNSAAYVSEIVRAGIDAVDKGQMEAARSLGLSHGQAMRKVILPQAIKIMIPSMMNQFIIAVKDTSILTVIGVNELVQRGKIIVASNFRAFEVYGIIAIMYLILIGILMIASKNVERRLAYGGKGK